MKIGQTSDPSFLSKKNTHLLSPKEVGVFLKTEYFDTALPPAVSKAARPHRRRAGHCWHYAHPFPQAGGVIARLFWVMATPRRRPKESCSWPEPSLPPPASARRCLTRRTAASGPQSGAAVDLCVSRGVARALCLSLSLSVKPDRAGREARGQWTAVENGDPDDPPSVCRRPGLGRCAGAGRARPPSRRYVTASTPAQAVISPFPPITTTTCHWTVLSHRAKC